jgi:hypothetical protein
MPTGILVWPARRRIRRVVSGLSTEHRRPRVRHRVRSAQRGIAHRRWGRWLWLARPAAASRCGRGRLARARRTATEQPFEPARMVTGRSGRTGARWLTSAVQSGARYRRLGVSTSNPWRCSPATIPGLCQKDSASIPSSQRPPWMSSSVVTMPWCPHADVEDHHHEASPILVSRCPTADWRRSLPSHRCWRVARRLRRRCGCRACVRGMRRAARWRVGTVRWSGLARDGARAGRVVRRAAPIDATV